MDGCLFDLAVRSSDPVLGSPENAAYPFDRFAEATRLGLYAGKTFS